MKKGISPLIEALLLVVMSVSLSVVILGWLPSVSTERAITIKNVTSDQLKCSFADLFIKSASYDCLNDCSSGIVHNLTVTVSNSGRIPMTLNKLYIQNKTGWLFELNLNDTLSVDPGTSRSLTNISTGSCAGINNVIDKIVVNSINCPNTGYDSIQGSDITFTRC